MTNAGYGANADLGIAGANEPPMSVEEATSRRAEMMGSSEWRTKYFNGDVAARADFDRITRALTPQHLPQSDLKSFDQVAEWARSQGDVSEAVLEDIRQDRPVTPLERKLAEARKAACFADKEWVRKYFDGGRAEKRELLLLNIILSSRVRDSNQP